MQLLLSHPAKRNVLYGRIMLSATSCKWPQLHSKADREPHHLTPIVSRERGSGTKPPNTPSSAKLGGPTHDLDQTPLVPQF